jgi:hypothetical protein
MPRDPKEENQAEWIALLEMPSPIAEDGGVGGRPVLLPWAAAGIEQDAARIGSSCWGASQSQLVS